MMYLRKVEGILGGEFRYGIEWSGPTFLMHPYCTCEKEDCPWCAGCIRTGEEFDLRCDFCSGSRFPLRGALPGTPAPNFWYKPTGVRIWWYKYIGRNMELSSLGVTWWDGIVRRCLREVKIHGAHR